LLRFAQSPTEDLSINSLRNAIFNYIISKQLNEGLLIRIDDIEKEKNIEGKDKEILELLNLFSIEYSHAIHQSDNLKYHQKLAMQLMGQKKAFACFCSDNKLDELKEKAKKEGKPFEYDGFCSTLSDETVLNCNAPFTVRINKPEKTIKFSDKIKGDVEFKPYEIDSFHILNQDKSPTYDYACAVDDMLSNISTIIRTEEDILSTSRQIYGRSALNFDLEINYIHLPDIVCEDIPSVKTLIDDGFLPSAIANYLVLLGNETPNEIFTLEEAIEWFDIKNISKETIKFDIEKLKCINKKHLELMDEMRLSKILGFADADIGKLGKLFLEEASTLNEIKSKLDLIFAPKSTLVGYEEQFVELKLCIQDAPYFENFNDLEAYIVDKTALNGDNLLKPLTYVLTGRDNGPDISNIYPLIKNYIGEIVK